MEWSCRSYAELTLADLYDALALRAAVFVVEQRAAYQDLDGNDQRCRHVFVREPGGAMLAYARVVPAGLIFTEASVGRVVCASAARGRGLGREVVARSLAELERWLGPQAVRISAQRYLTEFYRGFAFGEASEEYLEDGIPHVEMLRPRQKAR